MGIFSFLSRKSHDKKAASLRAHAYDTIAAGTVPVQGAYPVAGNGPNVFDTLSRERPDFRHTQLSLMVPNNGNGAAPAPGVPRYRDPSVERPNTAPNGRPPSLQHMSSGTRLRKAGKKPPPVSFKMLRTGSTINGASRPGSQGSEFESKSISRGTVTHSRSNSMRSDGGRSKDILDAHSELKPPDFRARVKATGAKDYGEDVAERNMGENGFDLESEHVKAFYDSHPNAPRTRKSIATLTPRSSKHTIRETPNSQPQPTWPMVPPLPPPPVAPSQRQLPKALAGQIPKYKSTDTALYADMKTTGGGHLKRRVSVNTYMPPTSHNNTSAVSLSKVHGSEINTIDLDILKSPIVMGAPRTSRESPRIARIPRDSVMLARRKVSVPDHLASRDSSPERMFSLRSATQPHRASSMSSANAPLPRKRHSLHTLHSSISSSIQSRDTFIQATQLAYPRPHTATLPFQQPAQSGAAIPAAAFEDGPDSVDCMETPPSHKTPSTIPKIQEESIEASPPSWDFSVVLPLSPRPATAIPFEIFEQHVPIRTRSLRGYSASSGTPTTNTTARSSSPGRPQSRQTTTTITSVSFSLAPSSPRLSVKPATALSPPPTPRSDNFNIDDYLSSDNDSIAPGARRPTAEGEEELLWKDGGYGGTGLQLPGLFDMFPDQTAKSEQRTSSMLYHSRYSPDAKPLKMSYSYNGIGDSFGPVEGRRRSRYILDTAAHYQSTTEEEDCEGYYEIEELEEVRKADESDEPVRGRQMVIGRSRGRGVKKGGRRRRLEGISREEGEVGDGGDADDEEGTPRIRQTPRQQSRGRASVASYYEELRAKVGVDVIEEEREAVKVDVAAAVKLRKQIKTAQRLAGKSSSGGIRLRRVREGGENKADLAGNEGANIELKRGKSVPVLCVEGEEYRD